MAGDDQPRRLTRGRDSRLGGVLGGIAEYLDVDPTVVRVLFIALLLLGFLPFGVLIYIVLWILMPRYDQGPVSMPSASGTRDSDPGLALGVMLLVVGVVVLLSRGWFSPWVWFGMHGGLGWMLHITWPVLIIGLGIWLVMSARGRSRL